MLPVIKFIKKHIDLENCMKNRASLRCPKRNVYIDSVNVRMNYMNESDQKMVLKFVEDFSDYILEREKGKE